MMEHTLWIPLKKQKNNLDSWENPWNRNREALTNGSSQQIRLSLQLPVTGVYVCVFEWVNMPNTSKEMTKNNNINNNNNFASAF